MGGKSKQSQRTKNNVRPSSSGRSAELLNNQVHIDPSSVTSGGKALPVIFPTLAAPLDPGLNPDFILCFKKLNKKDPITKTKALQELTELVKKSNVDDVAATLPSWAHYYRSLTTDTDHKVREATQVAHGAIVRACGRRVAPQLRALLPAWLPAQFDEYAPAAAAARAALATTFPENKLPDVISFCMTEVMAHLLENLVGNAEATMGKKSLTPEEQELQRARRAAAGLQALGHVVQRLPAARGAGLWRALAPLLQAPAFWALAAHKSPQVKASWFGALGCVIARYGGEFGAAHGARAGRLLLAGAADAGGAGGAGGASAQLWGCLLLLMHHVPDWHTWLDKKELLVKRIIDVLENGGWGDAKHLSSMLLPLLAYLPEYMVTKEFYESFFGAVFKGLVKKGVITSKSERQSWITSLSECLRYLTVQDKDYAVEVATSVHRTWLELILLNPYDSQTTNNLIKHSAINMVALVKYWLKQSKETNGDKYDQLVRNFWQNIASTMVAQIDKLSTERNDITSLIEGHTLLLQSLKTSFSSDAKKTKSIKFNDEQQATAVESEESTQQCDATVVDRYHHNLNEVVQKICAHYFEFANRKQVANYVFASLITLVIEFDDKNLFVALARHFNVDSVFGFYDKVLRDWLAGDTMRCKAVTDIVFLSMKHMSEIEQEAMLNSFKQFPPSVVEWCISLSLSHPHRGVPAVRRWLRGELVGSSLAAVCRRMVADDDGASRGLLLMCLAHDEQGEIMISPSTVSRIVELVSSALSEASAAPERLAGAACALASELGSCPELALALLRLQLSVPRGDARLSAAAWCEVRAGWQDAGAGAAGFRAGAVAALRRALRLHPDTVDIQHIEHVASLCPYLLPQFAEARLPGDARDAADLVARLFHAPDWTSSADAVRTHALRVDCVRARLNCPFDDDNEYIKAVVQESSSVETAELTLASAAGFLRELVFRAALLRALASHRGGRAAWCGDLLREEYFQDQFARILHDYAVVCSLYEGYAFWPHHSIISVAKSHLSSSLDDVIADMPAHTRASMLARLAGRAAADGYYWGRARALLAGAAGDAGGGGATTAGGAAELDLEAVVTGNGFFHTLQADTESSSDKDVILNTKNLLMLRSFYLAHAHDAAGAGAGLAAGLATAAGAGAAAGLDAVIDAYYRHPHTMLYESDIATASWRQVVSNAAVAECLAAAVAARGWEAPAAHWDFAAISLCSLAAAVQRAGHAWGCPKVALLARAVFALARAAHGAVGSVAAESLRRQPSAHVAQLPTEWRDIFAPDLYNNLFRIVLKVLETTSPDITASQAAFISGLHPLVEILDWHMLPRGQQASLPVSRLLAAAAATLRSRAHHALKYLAHALLAAAGKPIVIHDASALAAWSEEGAGAGDEEEAPRVRLALALAGLQPALTELQDLVDMALLAFRVGEETCEMVPFTDSHSVVLGYLLLADAAFSICQLARGDLTHHYLELFREPKHAEMLITACLRLLPRGVAAHALAGAAPPAQPEPAFEAAAQPRVDAPSTALDVARLACRGLFHCGRWAGGAARGWWGAAPPRAARALERVFRAHVSAALVRDERAAVLAGAAALEDAEVSVLQSTNEIVCVYRVEERALELRIELAGSHPLTPPRVAASSPAAPAHHTHWLAVYLAYQNGTVINALRMWMDTVARRVEASPQCYICYCRLHPATGRLPRVPCHQCRNKFHSHCLRKWFASSSKSNCPLCRATF